ncbi:MAG: hypothetical protein JKY34_08725 [Kordiimonadaceae bacterium]|nr:hypothetical protein [Kordiimonadaceae bacterium]
MSISDVEYHHRRAYEVTAMLIRTTGLFWTLHQNQGRYLWLSACVFGATSVTHKYDMANTNSPFNIALQVAYMNDLPIINATTPSEIIWPTLTRVM